MIAFVDYDNIERRMKSKGLSFIIETIVSKIQPSETASDNHITFRLYGGWYEESNFTKRAQDVSLEASENFPTPMLLSDNRTKVIVNCTMAYSLMCDPTNHLFSTYRPKGMPQSLKVREPKSCGCTEENCPLDSMVQFMTNKLCSGCSRIKPADILYRGEQKLVDTMLTSDLIYTASDNPSSSLCIVSSDDDFWPGIMTTLANGVGVLHIQTKDRSTPNWYSRNAKGNYIQKTMAK